MSVLFDGELMADYHQIYLADTAGNFAVDYPEVWDEAVLARRVNLGRGVIVVSTARNMPTRFRVELHEAEPGLDLAAADHAVECSIVTAGEIVIAGATDYAPDAARAQVPAGPLRALIVSTGLATISDDGLDGVDAYVAHVWPAPEGPVAVRKQWREG